MTQPVILRARALQDVEEALDHLLVEAGETVAQTFIDALELAQTQIARQPGIGSLRHGHELQMRGLRAWALRGHPYLLFYLERADHLDVLRVLHQRRDLAAWLSEST